MLPVRYTVTEEAGSEALFLSVNQRAGVPCRQRGCIASGGCLPSIRELMIYLVRLNLHSETSVPMTIMVPDGARRV